MRYTYGGKPMKKRMLPLILAAILALSVCPVWAEDTAECSCQSACTQEARNEECALCGGADADLTKCRCYVENTEEKTASETACVCDTACTEEGKNGECPVCGAENAKPEDCAKYKAPAEAPQTEEGEAPQASSSTATVTTESEWNDAMGNPNITDVIVQGSFKFDKWSTGKKVVISNGYTLTWNDYGGSLGLDSLEIASGGTFKVSTVSGDKRTVSGSITNNGTISIGTKGEVGWNADTTGSGSVEITGSVTTYFNYGKVPANVSGSYFINIVKDISQRPTVTLPDGLKVGDTVRATVSNLLDGVDPAEVFKFKWTQNGNERYNGAATPTLVKDGTLKLDLSTKGLYKMRTSSWTVGSISASVTVSLPSYDTIYVDAAKGLNSNVGNTKETPVQTLYKALENVADNGTIVLLSDCTESERFISKNVTIKSGGTEKYSISCKNSGILLSANVSLTLDGVNVAGETSLHGETRSGQTLTVKNATVAGAIYNIPTVRLENVEATGYIQDVDALYLTDSTLNKRLSVKDLIATGKNQITIPKNTPANLDGAITLTDNTPITLIPANLAQGERLVQVPNGSPDSIAENFVLKDDNGGTYAPKCRPYFSNTTYIGISQKLTAQDIQLAVIEPELGKDYNNGDQDLDRRPTKFYANGVWSGSTGPDSTWAVGDTPQYTVTLSATNPSNPWYYFDEAFAPEALRVYSWDENSYSETAFTDSRLNSTVRRYFANGQGVAQDDGRTVTLTLEYPQVKKYNQTITGDLSDGAAVCGDSLEARKFSCATSSTLLYESSDPTVASVDAYGKVTVHKPGTVTITVTAPESALYNAARVSYKLTVSHQFRGDWQQDETSHWKLCACGEVGEKAAHSGGTATCTKKADCHICGQAYGETDPNNHAELRHVPMKEPTYWSKGNREYWYCADCGKYYLDAAATKEITQAETVLPSLRSSDGNPKTGDILLPLLPLLLAAGAMAIALPLALRKKPGGKYLRR